MQRGSRWAAGAWLFAVLGALAPAQQPGPGNSGVTIRSETQEVVLDLLVRDSKGRIVKTLKPEEIEIYEDGVRRDVRSFRLVAGREAVQAQPSAPAQPASAKAPHSLRGNPLPAVNLICIVFHNLDSDTRLWAMAAAEEFLKSNLQPGTWVGLFSLGGNGRLAVLQPFTDNREDLLRAVRNAPTGINPDFLSAASAVLNAAPTTASLGITVNGAGGPGASASIAVDVAGGDVNTQAIGGADVSTARMAKVLRGQQADFRQEFGHIAAMQGADQMIEMFDRFGTLPGHKTVLLLTPGMISTGDPVYFQKILDRAHKADVAVYAIDTNGLTQNSNLVASKAALGYAASVSARQARYGQSLSTVRQNSREGDMVMDTVRTSDQQAHLRALSEGTGGFLIGSTNDLRKPFQRVVEDVDTHYAVTYVPASEKADGRLRTIEVKLAHPDWTVQSRTGYYALPELSTAWTPTQADLAALAALNVKPAPHAFEFRTAALQFPRDRTVPRSALVVEIPVADLAATMLPEQKKRRVRASLLALVKDADGQIVDRVSKEESFDVPEEEYAVMRSAAITLTHPFELAPGHYTIETAAIDRESRRYSVNSTGFDVQPRKGVGLSSVSLVQRLEPAAGAAGDAADLFQYQGQRVVPELGGKLGADARTFAYFVVYPDKANSEKPKILLEFLVGGKLAAQRTSELPPPDASGAIPLMIRAATKPGDCELRITALQGDDWTKQILRYTVAVP